MVSLMAWPLTYQTRRVRASRSPSLMVTTCSWCSKVTSACWSRSKLAIMAASISAAGGGAACARAARASAVSASSVASPGRRPLVGKQDGLLRRIGPRVAHRAVVEPVGVEEDFKERRPLERALDQELGERVLDVLLQGAAQGAGAVAAIEAGLVHDPFLGFGGARDGDVALGEVVIELLHQQLDEAKKWIVD